MLKTVFDGWVQEAEKKLLASGDVPLVDSQEIDMADKLWDLAHEVVEEGLGECCSSLPSNIEPTIRFLESRLIGSRFALPVRFVILNFLYRLAHFERFASKTAAPELHWVVWPHFEHFVGLHLQEVGSLKDPRAIRWEITNACAIHNWDLATELLDLLKSLRAITAVQYREIKGQMYVCSVAAPKHQEELDEELGVAGRDDMGWWILKLDSAFFPLNQCSRRPLALLAWGMDLADQTEYSAEECVRLSDAAHEWEISFQQDRDLLGSYRAAWGKAYFLTKNYLKAAGQFEHLLAYIWGMPKDMEDVIRSRVYQDAAECYEKAADVEAAVRLVDRCAHEFPRTKGLWLKLAGLYLSSPLDLDLEKVRDCISKERDLDPSFGKDPRTSFALTLGELAPEVHRATLRKATEPSPADLQFMTAVVSRHWPAFQSLDKDSQKRWVGAARWLWGASTPPEDRSLLGRKVACTFAEIVEGELQRLFDRFRQEKGSIVLQNLQPNSRKEKFPKYLEGSYLNLGDMIAEIDGTRRLPEPRYPDLKAWLQRNARPLVSQSWDSKRAWRLNDLRCAFTHPGAEFSEQDAIELYGLSVWFLNQLCGDRRD
jgi:tetratricopeptide (TPR) repeat protein